MQLWALCGVVAGNLLADLDPTRRRRHHFRSGSGGASRTLGAYLSSDDCGSRVERAARLHPLWQAATNGGL